VIAEDIKVLHNMAKQLRARRFENGALAFDSMRLTFELDDKGLPVDCGPYHRYEAHYLVEEVSAIDLVLGHHTDHCISSCWPQTSLLLKTLLLTSPSKLCFVVMMCPSKGAW
jgi:hypothetical protein